MFHRQDKQRTVGRSIQGSRLRLRRCPLRRLLPGIPTQTCDSARKDADILQVVLEDSRLETLALAVSGRMHPALIAGQHGTHRLLNQ